MGEYKTDYMEDETDTETYTLELTASDMFSLRTILSWASVEMEDHQRSIVASSLSKEVSESITSEDFTEQMDKEYEEAIEEFENQQDMASDIPGMGVQ